jgi:hypothetical protein
MRRPKPVKESASGVAMGAKATEATAQAAKMGAESSAASATAKAAAKDAQAPHRGSGARPQIFPAFVFYRQHG